MTTTERAALRDVARGRRRWSRAADRAGLALGLAIAGAACAAPHNVELSELQRDHELCLGSAQQPAAAVRYEDYQDCMLRHGWSDAELHSRTG